MNPGTVLVEAHPEEFSGKVIKAEPNAFYVLNDNPVLSGEDINNPQQGIQNEGGGSGLPDVTFGFSSHGRKTVFEAVTKRDRPARRRRPAAGHHQGQALQHFAIVLDEQVITAPSIDYTQYPDRDRRLETARRSPAASRSPPRRTSRTSFSPARCRSSWN